MKKIFVLIILLFVSVPVFGYYNNYYNNYNPQPAWQVHFNNGKNLLNQKRYYDALSEFTESQRWNPSYVDTHFYISYIHYKKEEFSKALEYINNAINLAPNNDGLYGCRGRVKDAQKDYFGAIADYSTAIKLNPQNWEYYLCRGENYYKTKRYFAALQDYKNSLKIKPNDDAISNIKKIKSDFKNPVFLIKNWMDIIGDLGCWQCIILLLCIFIITTTTYTEKNDITFKTYDRNYIYQRFHFERLNINTPIPRPEEFGLDSNRINYLEKIYKNKNKNKSLLEELNESGSTLLWAIILSFPFIYFMDNILTMYFLSPLRVPNEDLLFVIETGIPAIIIFCTFKKLPIFLNKLNITEHECETYLLYRGSLDIYNEKISSLKTAEEERLRQIEEAERQKAEAERQKQLAIERQKRSYWQKYWAEKQKDGHGFGFERAVGELYGKMGYKYTVTKGTGDGGVDIILYKDGIKTIVQCKAHKHVVGPNDLRALWGCMQDFKAQKAIFIAYAGVTNGAKKFTRGKDYKILSVKDLIELSLKTHLEQINN